MAAFLDPLASGLGPWEGKRQPCRRHKVVPVGNLIGRVVMHALQHWVSVLWAQLDGLYDTKPFEVFGVLHRRLCSGLGPGLKGSREIGWCGCVHNLPFCWICFTLEVCTWHTLSPQASSKPSAAACVLVCPCLSSGVIPPPDHPSCGHGTDE